MGYHLLITSDFPMTRDMQLSNLELKANLRNLRVDHMLWPSGSGHRKIRVGYISIWGDNLVKLVLSVCGGPLGKHEDIQGMAQRLCKLPCLGIIRPVRQQLSQSGGSGVGLA